MVAGFPRFLKNTRKQASYQWTLGTIYNVWAACNHSFGRFNDEIISMNFWLWTNVWIVVLKLTNHLVQYSHWYSYLYIVYFDESMHKITIDDTWTRRMDVGVSNIIAFVLFFICYFFETPLFVFNRQRAQDTMNSLSSTLLCNNLSL